jgi:hypothetical protein
MITDALIPLPAFWVRNCLSKTQYYYLKRLGRGPRVMSIGTKEVVSPEAESEWRQEMISRPLKGDLRKLVLKAEAERAELSEARQ